LNFNDKSVRKLSRSHSGEPRALRTGRRPGCTGRSIELACHVRHMQPARGRHDRGFPPIPASILSRLVRAALSRDQQKATPT
jgi:hypothetical protein